MVTSHGSDAINPDLQAEYHSYYSIFCKPEESSVELKACVSERTPLAGDTEHDEAGDELTWADLVLDPSFP